MKKKLFHVLVAVIITSMFPISVNAAEFVSQGTTQSITIEEYERAIQKECIKYGVEAFILDYDPNICITEDMLIHGVNKAREYAQSVSVNEITIDNNVREHADSEENNTPYGIMPFTDDYSATFLVENTYGSAEMRLDANITTNIANNTIMYVNSVDVYQLGAFVNFVSWENTNITYEKDYPHNCWVTFTIKGKVTFAYADPWTSITTGYSSNESETVMIDCT